MHDTGNIPNKHSIVDLSEEEIQKEIERLISDRDAFNAFVYTPLNEALSELDSRQKKIGLTEKVKKLLPAGVPDILLKKSAVLFRHVATPNYETRRFINIIDAIDELKPVVWEYLSDKFTSNNECKHALGKMHFHYGAGKKGGQKINHLTIIDFNKYNGSKISEVKTLDDKYLADLHHDLFCKVYPKIKESSFFDSSDWFKKSGENAKNYYKHFLALFIQDGILFENFMLNVKEIDFVKDIFLPAFIEVLIRTGEKPLIVSLLPTDIEGDMFWLCHTPETEEYIRDILK